jgi:hypothetical protein
MCVCPLVLQRRVYGAVKVKRGYRLVGPDHRPPLWSSGQFLATDPEVPALPDFLRSSGSATVSTQPREDN